MNARGARVVFGALVVMTLSRVTASAWGQATPLWNLSARAEGMAGASAGVTWGDPNLWGNVATLASVEGVRWQHARTAYEPFRWDHVEIRSDQLLLGHAGIALGTAGIPPGFGRYRWDTVYPQGAASPSTWSTRAPSAQLAASLPRAWSAFRGTRASAAYDVSLGAAYHRWIEQFTPGGYPGEPPTRFHATAWSVGMQARWSPLRFGDRDEPPGDVARRLRWDVGAGVSVLDAFGSELRGAGATAGWRLLYNVRYGAATRLAIAMPRRAGDPPRRYSLAGLPHLASLGVAYDHEIMKVPNWDVTLGHRDLAGAELSLADVVVLRTGHVVDSNGIEGWSFGWGAGLPLGRWGGFRYDEARVPFYEDAEVPHLTRTGWTLWCDALSVWRETAAKRGGAAQP